MAKRQSRSRKHMQRRYTKKNKSASCGCKKNVKNIRQTRRALTKRNTGGISMRGGFVSCNDKVITEPGFNVPAFGKAPGLSIPDSKVAIGSSDQVKVDHPMVAS